MIDIDNFKLVNDTYGHLVGDQILREISQVISETVRKIDIPARYGGEEFSVILPETSKDEATIIAERLRAKIAELCVNIGDDREVRPTASFGIAQYPVDGLESKSIIGNSDIALYHSKHNGKNSVTVFYQEGCEQLARGTNLYDSEQSS
jgi:diguanylate cyclase (GGDEF)-like protein